MYVTVRVRLDAALTLQKRRKPTKESTELLQTAKGLGVLLKPVHPGAEDPLLAPYYSIEVPDLSKAEQVKARLLLCKAVEAAYVKPPDELP